jgi:spermidine/putrescine transport system substrate-binding protein
MYSRRDFLRDAGLLTLGGSLLTNGMAADKPRTLRIATWATYYNSNLYKDFTKQTGITVEAEIFESNEAMLGKLIAGDTSFDVMVATSYTLPTYVSLELIQALTIEKLTHFDERNIEQRLLSPTKINGKTYAIPKTWGTTGYVINTAKLPYQPNSWREFWDLINTKASKHATVHDYQATTIGNALKYFGYSFNSTKTNELLKARELLMRAKPHLSAITSDSIKAMRNDAWIAMAWTGDGVVLNRENPDIKYIIGKEGGEVWIDNYVIPTASKNTNDALNFINYLQDPQNSLKDVTVFGYLPVDKRVTALLSADILNNKIMFPSEDLMANLEVCLATTISNPLRAEILSDLKKG